ncbi:response regulator transcription factor [Flavobacterium sp.]|uniref:response regulator transcription factor n=1 Tax=Flavobacterium sp. TaxID=239 RepID=UPI0040337DAE
MPYTDCFSLAAKIRHADTRIPMMFLTARSDIRDIREGYASGGNDYLRKPFSLDELFLRVEELLRRNNETPGTGNGDSIGSYAFYYNRQELAASDGSIVKLSHKEAELLSLLLQHRNRILGRKAALLKLWGDDSYFNTRNMDVYITRLRAKLKTDPSVEIVNIRGYGYKLIC